jgi:hypothetical protein
MSPPSANSPRVNEDNLGSKAIGPDTSRRDLQGQIYQLTQERDNIQFLLNQANQEIDRLRASSREASKYKLLYEHMRRDFDSLRVSFESSEKIRQQQKELISLLNRSREVYGPQDRAKAFLDESLSPSLADENTLWLVDHRRPPKPQTHPPPHPSSMKVSGGARGASSHPATKPPPHPSRTGSAPAKGSTPASVKKREASNLRKSQQQAVDLEESGRPSLRRSTTPQSSRRSSSVQEQTLSTSRLSGVLTPALERSMRSAGVPYRP